MELSSKKSAWQSSFTGSVPDFKHAGTCLGTPNKVFYIFSVYCFPCSVV